mmetsp:Transcript_120107/g.275167  ORF Transcript_120107/g.275167 Transcript_120107/m.275167 type:complete len:567 (+) Transcript_120107:533-2233(+)
MYEPSDAALVGMGGCDDEYLIGAGTFMVTAQDCVHWCVSTESCSHVVFFFNARWCNRYAKCIPRNAEAVVFRVCQHRGKFGCAPLEAVAQAVSLLQRSIRCEPESLEDRVASVPPGVWLSLARVAVGMRHVDRADPDRILVDSQERDVKFGLCRGPLLASTTTSRGEAVHVAIIAVDMIVEQFVGAPHRAGGPVTLEVTLHAYYEWEAASFLDATCNNSNATVAQGTSGVKLPTDMRSRTQWHYECHLGGTRIIGVGRARRPTMVHVRCPIKRTVFLGDHINVTFVARTTEMNSQEEASDIIIPIEVCASTPVRVSSAACTEPLYGMDTMEKRWPGHFSRWVHYHLYTLRYGLLDIYDLDGSVADLVWPFAETGRVRYWPRWSSMIGLDRFDTNCKYVGEYLAYQHCAVMHRGVSQWVAIIHSPDSFLVPGIKSRQGSSGAVLVADLLSAASPDVASFILGSWTFDGPRRSSSGSVLQDFPWRRKSHIGGHEYVIYDPKLTDYAEPHGVLHLEHVPYPGAVYRVAPELWVFHHYVSIFVERNLRILRRFSLVWDLGHMVLDRFLLA